MLKLLSHMIASAIVPTMPSVALRVGDVRCVWGAVQRERGVLVIPGFHLGTRWRSKKARAVSYAGGGAVQVASSSM